MLENRHLPFFYIIKYIDDSKSAQELIRGGSYRSAGHAGVFAATLFDGRSGFKGSGRRSYSRDDIGFRCVLHSTSESEK